MEFAGVVEAVGAAVTEFEVGDDVFGVTGAGAHAEFTCIRESEPGRAHAGGHELRGGGRRLRRRDAWRWRACGRRALWTGGACSSTAPPGRSARPPCSSASTSAPHVTAVCNTKTVELVRSLGADEVIDYTREDFTKNGKTYDVIFDAVGKHSFRRCRRSLKPGGTTSDTDLGFMWHVPLLSLLTRWVGDKTVALGITRYAKQDVELLEGADRGGRVPAGRSTGAIRSRTSSRRHRYVETGQKTGNVVLTVG